MSDSWFGYLVALAGLVAYPIAVVIATMVLIVGVFLAARLAPTKQKILYSAGVGAFIFSIEFGDYLLGRFVAGVLCNVEERFEYRFQVPLAAKYFELHGGVPRVNVVLDEGGRSIYSIGGQYEVITTQRTIPFTFGVVRRDDRYVEIATGKEIGRHWTYGYSSGWIHKRFGHSPRGKWCSSNTRELFFQAAFTRIDDEG